MTTMPSEVSAIVLLAKLHAAAAAVDDLADAAVREDPAGRWIQARERRLARQRLRAVAKAARFAPLRFGDGVLARIVSGAGRVILDAMN